MLSVCLRIMFCRVDEDVFVLTWNNFSFNSFRLLGDFRYSIPFGPVDIYPFGYEFLRENIACIRPINCLACNWKILQTVYSFPHLLNFQCLVFNTIIYEYPWWRVSLWRMESIFSVAVLQMILRLRDYTFQKCVLLV